MPCPSCGAIVPDGARFCPTCGHGLQAPRPDERRVATVLFADLVGFTTLSESRDPEQVKNLVDSCFERLVRDIAAFGGRVDKIIGDAIVALFGAPVSHEDDPERAVRAALRMQQTLAEHTSRLTSAIQMRIGVNTGEVLVGPLRAGGDYTALGDAVNIAQRLQVAAPPGGVLVGPATHAATEAVIQYESMGGLHARGREELVDAWLAVEPIVPPGLRPRRLRAPLVGRSAERQLLLDGFRLAVTHHRAFHAQIEGEGGVGKSRLAEEVLAEAKAASGATVLVSRCLPYGEADVWGPVARAIRSHAGLQPLTTPDEVRERATRAVVAALGVGPETPDVQRVTEGILQLLGEATALDGIDSANARSEVVRSVLAFLEGLVRQAPLIVTVGDLHWADSLVLDLLDRIVTELGNQPFALITTSRPSETERRRTPVGGRHNAVLLRLDPLDQQSAADLVRTLLGGDVDADVEEELLDRSGGNPLFLEELAALVQASGEVGGLPDTLRGLVAARLDELSIDERNMLENAAVLGSWGTWQGLVEFGGALNQSTRRDTLVLLVSRELLDVDGDEWAFRSESVREVAYHTLTKMARAQRHKGVADTLALIKETEYVDAIAHHYATSAELTHELGRVPGVSDDIDDLAIEWLTRSAERDLDQLVYPGVERRTARGLALLDSAGADADDPRRQRLLLVRGHARSDVHDIEAASADAKEVLSVATRTGDHSLAGDAHLLLGEIAQQATRYDEAVHEYESAVELFRQLDDRARLAEALRSWGMAAILGGEFGEAERLLDEADALFEDAGDRKGHAWVDQHRAWIAFVQGELELADARLHAAAETFEEMGDSGGLGWTMGLLAWVRYQQGRLDEAEALATDVAREAGLRGERWAQAMMWVLLAALRLWRGHAESGLAMARQARDTFRDLSDRWGELQALVPMSRALAALGRAAEAEQTAEGAMALGVRMNMPALGATVAAGLAAHLGRGEQAVAAGRLAVEELLEEGLEGVGLDAKVGLALGLLQVGDTEEAQAVLASVDDERSGHGYLASAEALVLAASGQPVAAAEVASTVSMSPGSSYLDRQTAAAALGLVAAQQGDETEARRVLTAGIMGADATDDRVARALARLALAVGLESLGTDDAASARTDAEEQLAALGIEEGNGWSIAYALAARPQTRQPAG